MHLLLLSKPEFFIEEHQILTLLFDEGLETLHLKKPDTEPVYSERLLTLIPEKYHQNIVVHQHFYLKEEYGLKGIHLSKNEADVPENYKGCLSCTCNTIEDIVRRKKMCNYVILTDIEKFSDQELEEAAEKGIIDRKVAASGNLTEDILYKLRDLNFGGVLVNEELWSQFDIHTVQDYRELVGHFKELQKATE